LLAMAGLYRAAAVVLLTPAFTVLVTLTLSIYRLYSSRKKVSYVKTSKSIQRLPRGLAISYWASVSNGQRSVISNMHTVLLVV